MSKSTHQIAIKAVDQTSGGFSSIQARAADASSKIRGMLGGAIAAAGAYLGLSKVKGGIDELGHLSDVAQKTSTSVDDLTRAATALNILGIQNMGVDQIGKAFDYMAKTTGRSGMEGFRQTISELGKIPDVAQRGQEAMRIFGRSGMEFAPLINAAQNGAAALDGVIAAMPAIPQAAADAGDDAADAMAIAGNEVKSLWLRALGKVSEGLQECFGGSLRGSMLKGIAYVEYFVNLVWRKIVNLGSNIGNVFSTMGESWMEVFERIGIYLGSYFKNLGSAIWETITTKWGSGYVDRIVSIWDQYSSAMQDAVDTMFEKVDWSTMTETVTKDLEENLRKSLASAAAFDANYDNAAISTQKRIAMDKGGIGVGAGAGLDAARQTQISNALIMGGSNAATRLNLVGPALQNEQKRTNALLQKVVDNTSKTAEEIKDLSDESAAVLD